MHNKALTIKIIAALGIPLFPLGARFFLAHDSAPVFGEAAQAPQGIPEIEATALEPEGAVKPGSSVDEAFPPIGAETLARVFHSPNTGAAKKQPPEGITSARAQPVPGDGKFSYLGSIRDANDRQWLCIKDEETGMVISVNADMSEINEEHWVVEIQGTSYSIRRN
jgi:hypothetical protein